MNRRFCAVRALKFFLFAVLFLVVAGGVTMSLWNWLVPVLFKGPVISFGQAVGLLALSKLLFGGFHRGGGGARACKQRRYDWRQKMDSRLAAMTAEQRACFQERFGKSCFGEGTHWAATETLPTVASEGAR